MLNLADYGSSDDETTNDSEKPNESSSSKPLMASLPKPAVSMSRKANEECELEDIVVKKHKWETKHPPKKPKGTVKISIPTVPDDESDSDEGDLDSAPRKVRGPSGPSTLLSMLPAPKKKTTPSMTPKVVKIGVSPSQTEQIPLSKVVENAKAKPSLLVPSTVLAAGKKSQQGIIPKDYCSDDESDEESSGNFFRLDSNGSPTVEEGTEQQPYTAIDQNPVHSSRTNFVHPSQMYNYANISSEELVPGASNRDKNLEEARRIIHKNEIASFGDDYVLPEDLEILDVTVDSQLGNVRENLMKTTRPADPALEAARLAIAGGTKKKKDKPAMQAKRKHQITYLAHLVITY